MLDAKRNLDLCQMRRIFQDLISRQFIYKEKKLDSGIASQTYVFTDKNVPYFNSWIYCRNAFET